MNQYEILDESLLYLNEGIKEVKNGAPYGKGEFKRLVQNLLKKTPKNKSKKKPTIKPSKNNKPLTDEERKAKLDRIEAEQKIVYKVLKECLNEMKKDPKFKEECIKSSIEFNKAEYYDDLVLKEGYIPKLEIKEGPDSDIIVIIDDYQMVNVQYSWILYWLTDMYEEKASKNDKYPKISFEYGDGDEGCLYVSEWY